MLAQGYLGPIPDNFKANIFLDKAFGEKRHGKYFFSAYIGG